MLLALTVCHPDLLVNSIKPGERLMVSSQEKGESRGWRCWTVSSSRTKTKHFQDRRRRALQRAQLHLSWKTSGLFPA